jgi:hypothetical protein
MRTSEYQMKPGNRSEGRSFLTGWRVHAIPGVVVRACKCRLRIRVHIQGQERIVSVDPENVLTPDDAGANVQPSKDIA